MVVRRSGQQGRGDPALSRSPARLARAWRRHGRAPRRRRVTLGGENARGGAAGRRRYLPGPATGGRVCCGAGARRLGSCEASPPRAWLPAHSPVSSAPHRSAICPAAASVRVGHAWVHSQLALCGAHPQLWWVPASEACAYNKCVCCFSQYRLRFKPQTGRRRRRGIQKNGAKTKNAGVSCNAARERWGGPLPRLAPWGPARGPLASGCLQQRRAGTRSCGACPARRPHGQAQARGRRAVPRALRAASSAASAAQSTCAAAGPRGRGACARCVRGVCAKRSGAGLLTPRREQAAELFQRGGGGGVAAGRAVGHAAGGCRRGCLF